MEDTNQSNTTQHDPNDFIIQGKESFAILFNIFNRTKKSQTIQEKQLSLLNNILESQNSILKELKDEIDEGKYRIEDGTASTTLTEIDIEQLLGHYIKSYTIINDGLNNIYIAHNPLNVSQDIFLTIKPDEKNIITYNRNKIKTIYIKTLSGTSDYRLTLTW